MKIKYFTGSSTTGVSETFIRQEVSIMRDWGWDVLVYSGRSSGDGDQVIYTGFSLSNLTYRIWRLFSFFKATKYADDYLDLGFQIRQKVASKKLKRSLQEDADFIWFSYLHYACYAGKALADSRVPYGISVHGVDATQELGSKQIRNAALALKPAFFVAPSHHLKRRLELIGVKQPIHVVPYESLPAVLQGSEEQYDFIALGRLTPKKCPEAVLMAFEIVLTKRPEVKLIWVGTGELESDLRSRFQHLIDSGSLTFAGALAHDEALLLLKSSGVFVQHSVTSVTGDQEGLPVSIVEALRNGKPVVSTLHSGIPEIVEDGKNGFLVQEHDYPTFADRMLRLFEDEKLRENMGKSAAATIERRIPIGSRSRKIRSLILSHI